MKNRQICLLHQIWGEPLKNQQYQFAGVTFKKERFSFISELQNCHVDFER